MGNWYTFGGDIGSSFINGAIQAGANYAIAKYNNQEAEKRERQARKENYEYGEKAADAADARARAQYADIYSPSAQMKQLKDAGLSPSIYASGGLPGGQGIGAQGGGAGNVQPNVFGISPIDLSTINLNNALAKKASAEADTESGNNSRGFVEIQKMLTEMGLNKANEGLIKAQTEYQNVVNEIQTATKDTSIKKINAELTLINHQVEQAFWQAKRTKQDFEFDQQTFNARVENINKQNAKLASDMLINTSQIDLNEAQKLKVQNEIEQSFTLISQKWYELAIKENDQQATETYMEEQIKTTYDKLKQELNLTKEQLDKWENIQKRGQWFSAANNLINTAGNVAGLFLLKGGALKGAAAATPTTTGTPTNAGSDYMLFY